MTMGTKVITALTILMSSTALAAGDVERISKYTNGSDVTLSGKVDSVQNEREFTLRDAMGKTINVDIMSNQSVTLEKGDAVTVTGKVDKDITGTDIDASSVNISKGLVEGMTDAVKSVPGVSTVSADAYDIGDLPDSGTVKVSGTVSNVDNEKEFTLRDDTGTINIDVVSAQNAALTKGAKVTVIGQMDSNLVGKDINASQVIVISSAKDKRASVE